MESLPELLHKEAEILRQIDEMEGEILPELEAAFKANESALRQKIDDYSSVLEILESQTLVLGQKMEKLSLWKKRCEGLYDRIRESLKDFGLFHNKRDLNGNSVRFKISNAKPSIEPKVPLEKLPHIYVKRKEVISADKEAILSFWQDNDKVAVEEFFNVKPSYSIREYPLMLKGKKDEHEKD